MSAINRDRFTNPEFQQELEDFTPQIGDRKTFNEGVKKSINNFSFSNGNQKALTPSHVNVFKNASSLTKQEARMSGRRTSRDRGGTDKRNEYRKSKIKSLNFIGEDMLLDPRRNPKNFTISSPSKDPKSMSGRSSVKENDELV